MTAAEESIRALIEHVISELVDRPDDVSVTSAVQEGGFRYAIVVHSTDVGKALGKQGRIVEALRTISHAVGRKYSQRISLEVLGAPALEPPR